MEPTSASGNEDEKIYDKNGLTIEPVKNGNVDFPKKGSGVDGRYLSNRQISVVFASFICNGLIFGLINSVGVIYSDIEKRLTAENVTSAATKASLVGSLGIGTTFLLSPVAGILTDQIGIRTTTFLGGFLASSGLLASSFLTFSVEALYFTYGVVLGVGASLAYTPSLVILGHYFAENLGVANGFVTAGSSVFSLAFPYLLASLIDEVKLEGCFRTLAGMLSLLMVCALVFKPVHNRSSSPVPKKRHNHTFRSRLSTVINIEIWKKRKFVIWSIALPIALFGYFVIYVHLIEFVKLNFPGFDGKILLIFIALASLIGRLIFGKLADFPSINRILLQQMSLFSMGVLTMLIVVANNYYIIAVIVSALGIFDGCLISLIGPVAFVICGQEGASQSIGFLLGLCSIPMTLGPPIAGFIFDQTKSYTYSFLLSGSFFLIGALLMCLMKCVHDADEIPKADPASEPLKQDREANQSESEPKSVILEMNGDSRRNPPSYKEATEGLQSNGTVNRVDPLNKAVIVIDNSGDRSTADP